MYNIHQQTYKVCKDALVSPKQPMFTENCPTMTAICSMLRQYRSSDTNPKPTKTVVSRNKDIIITAGSSTPDLMEKKNHLPTERVSF